MTLLLVVAIATAAAPALAQTGAQQEPPAGPQQKEWFALEITPIALGVRYGDNYGSDPKLLYAGPGVTIRLLRRKAERGYVTPIQLGFFIGDGGAVLAHAQAEAGVIVPVGSRELELGVAAGVGVLSINHPESPRSCDGRCQVGGAGLLLSSVVRCTLVYLPNLSIAVGVRAILPLTQPDNFLGAYTGKGLLVLGGIELAFGR